MANSKYDYGFSLRVPRDIAVKLKELAKIEHRSINSQVLVCIEMELLRHGL